MFEMDINTKLHCMLEDFEIRYGIYPNRIKIGYSLAREIVNELSVSILGIDTKPIYEIGKSFEYQGIPVEIDHINLNTLEVGHMIEWLENLSMYEEKNYVD